MRSVMVTKFLPLPANSGGKLRSLALLRALAARGDTVLCAFDDGLADLDGLRALGVDVRTVPWRPSVANVARGVLRTGTGSAGRFWDPRLAAVVRHALAEAPTDVLQVEYSQLIPYLSLGTARRTVLDLHNIESALATSYAESSSSPRARLARLESVLLRRVERRGIRRADITVVVSDKDRRRLPARARELLVCPNGWTPTEPLPPSGEKVVVFVALLGWRPNVDAAVHLVRAVWPHVRDQEPAARLLLVGRSPTPQVQALAGDGVEVTGTVPDIRPYLARACVATAPLLSGGGTRLKLLEALDAGRPVVATRVGADGLEDLVGDGVVIADEPAEMAKRILELLGDGERARELGLAGHRAVADRYAWDRVLGPLLSRLGA